MSESKSVGLALVIDYKDFNSQQDEDGIPVSDLNVIDLKSFYVISDTLFLIQTEKFDITPLAEGAGEYLTQEQICTVLGKMLHAIPKEEREAFLKAMQPKKKAEQEEYKQTKTKTQKLLVLNPQ